MSFEPIIILLIAPVLGIIYLSISRKHAERASHITLLIAVLLFRQSMKTHRDDIDHIHREQLKKELKGDN